MTEKSQARRKSSISIHDARIAGLYDLQKTIGKGHFAVVKLAHHVFTGEKVAVKVIDKTKFDPSTTSHLMKEVRCMKLVQHPNIVRLYEVIDTQTKLFLILELGDYDMYDFIMKNADKGCPENEAQQYFCQIIKAIDYCHQLHVVHRDLKPENVVFFERLGMVKLTDFGFSNKFTPGEQLETACGSLAYSAPEILLGDAYDAPAVDVWSLGVILYMLLCGRLPFQEANDSETLVKILDCKYSLPDSLSPHARYLISRMLVKDVKKRATLKEISENPWVKAGDLGLANILPLVGRDVLPESAHATIIEQMVDGGVDNEENILRSLENDDFSYVTATYYLLAERVLASYREERAREAHATERPSIGDLSADFENFCEMRETRNEEGSGYRSRSRSNSWRGSASASRRPCSILEEESEEELSTYYHSGLRQSSRFCSQRLSSVCIAIDHRTFSDSSLRRRFVHCSHSLITLENTILDSDENFANPFRSNSEIILSQSLRDYASDLDEFSPIRQQQSLSIDFEKHGVGVRSDDQKLKSPKICQLPREWWKYLPLRKIFLGTQRNNDDSKSQSHHRCYRTYSAPVVRNFGQVLRISFAKSWCSRSSKTPRRHSSPSTSAFVSKAGSSGRISPQAIQDLIELSRLSITESGRRALSPDSRYSSQSSSPQSSSGRTSPAFGRLKTSFATAGGLRKLSSSPHLLGICEETEISEFDRRVGERRVVTRRSISGAPVAMPSKTRLFTQLFKDDVLGAPVTYSKVRMIRPRQAIVSPDMARRYEQRPGTRFHSTRSRRSTSCSSSETSDDDSERRLNILASKCCHRNGNRRDKDDDPSKGSGGTSLDPSGSGGRPINGKNTNVSGSADSAYTRDYRTSGQSTTFVQYRDLSYLKWFSNMEVKSKSLHPIEEMPTTISSQSRLEIAEIAVKWINFSFFKLAEVAEERQTQCCATKLSNFLRTLSGNCGFCSFGCIFTLRQSSSLPDLSILRSHNRSSFFSWENSEERDDSSLWASTDSGCSSDDNIDFFPSSHSKRNGKKSVLEKYHLAIGEKSGHLIAIRS